MRLRHVLPIALLLLPSDVMADEVWDTSSGQVIYEADEGDVAILSYDTGGAERGYLYFPGLGGNFEDRGVFNGYWIAPGGGGESCGATLTGVNDVASTYWGRAMIVFHESGFPSGWTLMTGPCFAEPAAPVVGTPVTGE